MNGFTKFIGDLLPDLMGNDQKLTLKQIWALVKICRIARKYCRSGAALNNQLRRAFPYATFREVPKVLPARNGYPEKHYTGLEIAIDGQKGEDDTDGE